MGQRTPVAVFHLLTLVWRRQEEVQAVRHRKVRRTGSTNSGPAGGHLFRTWIRRRPTRLRFPPDSKSNRIECRRMQCFVDRGRRMCLGGFSCPLWVLLKVFELVSTPPCSSGAAPQAQAALMGTACWMPGGMQLGVVDERADEASARELQRVLATAKSHRADRVSRTTAQLVN